MQRSLTLLCLALCFATVAAFAPSPLALRSSPTLKTASISRVSGQASGLVGAKMVATLPPMDDEDTKEPMPNPIVSWWQGLSPGKQAVYAIIATKETAIVALNWGWIVSHIQGTAN